MNNDSLSSTPISDGWARYMEGCPHFVPDFERYMLMVGFYSGVRHVGQTIYSHGSGDITELLETFRREIPSFAEKLRAMGQAIGYEPVMLDRD